MFVLTKRIEDSELFAMKRLDLVLPLWAPYYEYVAELTISKEKIKTASGRVVKVAKSEGKTFWVWSDMSVSNPK